MKSLIELNIQWITLKKFCELTFSDLDVVKANIKNKGSLHKFTVRPTPRSQPLINIFDWMLSVTNDLRTQ